MTISTVDMNKPDQTHPQYNHAPKVDLVSDNGGLVGKGVRNPQPKKEIIGKPVNSGTTSSPGFIIENKNIVRLDLDSLGLTSLPDSISNLTALESLHLNKNQLRSLPDGIGNLINLKMLILNENFLTSLPNTLGNLKNLYKMKKT